MSKPEQGVKSRKSRGRTASLQTPEDLISYSKSEAKKKEIPIHVEQDSLLSTASGFDNYRGILHLGAILLVLTTFRVALDNLIKYGVLVNPIMWFEIVVGDPDRWPCTVLILTLNIYILGALLVEKTVVKRAISEAVVFWVYFVILASVLVVPTATVVVVAPNPVAAAFALSLHTITFLKLFSYMVVNRDLRKQKKQGHDVGETQAKQDKDNIAIYPENSNVKDIYYFMFAPTLCYELNFPRNKRIRRRYLLKRLGEVIIFSSMLLALGQQWLVPTIQNSMQPFKELNYSRAVERVLKLAVPNHFLWLMFFYVFFHSFLNLIGEVLRFADRGFYSDWWNAETIPEFWSEWNIPAHKWARRHVFKPMLHAGFSKLQAATVVFFISAFFHEFLVSVPLRMLRAWAFVGMISQIPLAYATSRLLKGYLGNIVVWLSLILGQPIAVLMYFHDYYIIHSSPSS
ncbi:diacylglycerol O-acyltransferase 1-like isoform X2 [Corticium candelabrum]|nr:diacylglycerol O-acyltransferase 1-like isoform X2 [Corticium candelabrum]